MDANQFVYIITENFNSISGNLYAFSLNSQKPDLNYPVSVGKKGMAWGRGLHRYWYLSGAHKMEGDSKAPAGLFTLSSLFGSRTLERGRMPFLKIHSGHRGVDDPRSTFYNVIVDENTVVPDWHSAEVMARPDGLYDLGVVVDHNADPITPGRGSCIFMHAWRGEGIGSEGCTVMAPENLEKLALWLDAEQDPCLVQIPKEGYLPFLSSLKEEPMKQAITKRLGMLMNA